MKALQGVITTVALLVPVSRAFPRQLDTATVESSEAVPAYGPKDTTTIPETVTPAPTTTPPPSASDSTTSSFTGHCDYSFCNSLGSDVCFYWAGYTSWDVSRGPIPGEIPTVLGPCSTDSSTDT
ncbi:hypothetical protein F5Y06DRAFT_196161 [Hypoxylon sp. FL0890]|nr:hypothetical protein F5Y06DRAFT_196161 [Hypoxylon sp. FL0890]